MEVMNCKHCKKLFNYISGPKICPACKEELEKKFVEVKEFIRDNPHKGISQVSEEMDVSVQQKQWVRQERLIFSEDSKVMIECEQCGAPIRTGRFCDNCKRSMANNLSKLYPNKEEPARKKGTESDKMRHFR